MPDSFLYQPHVHSEGGVLSPDVLIDRAAVVCPPDATVRPLPLHLVACTTSVQQVGAQAAGAAALVLVAASRGVLVSVGSAHIDLGAPDATLAQRLCAKPLSREAMRLDGLGDLASWRLVTDRISGRDTARIGATRLSELAGLPAILADWSRRNDPDHRALLFVSSGHRDPTPAAADGYAVALENERDGRRFALSYSVVRLPE